MFAMRETWTDKLPTSLCTVVGMDALQGKASSGCLGLGSKAFDLSTRPWRDCMGVFDDWLPKRPLLAEW